MKPGAPAADAYSAHTPMMQRDVFRLKESSFPQTFRIAFRMPDRLCLIGWSTEIDVQISR
ncbi:MAG: hypothetical protein O3A06_03230 [Proteobacteria bacterium]|nr:hypothetical protein [Pseudomonadota bacterium]